MKNHSILAAAALAAILASCGGEPRFEIKGTVEGASDKSLVLEKSDFHGYWIPVDSTRTSSSGSFSIKAPAPASPEIYRISMGDRFIYFPVDSVEKISLQTSDKDFGHVFTLSGSRNAELLASFEKDLLALQQPDSAAMAKFKRDVYTNYIKDGRGSIVSYYVLTKVVDGKPLYDPTDREDAKYYAAVATQFDQFRPNDPHGQMVKEVSIETMRQRNSAQGKKTMINAPELTMLDIDLPDETGKNVKLSDVVGKGKPVVLIFSLMNQKESPAFNLELSRIYNAHKGAVEFYHVSFDAGQYEWREAAKNLPWITVLDPQGNASNAVSDYNLQTLPALFLYNSKGELTNRLTSLDELNSLL